MKVSKLVIVLTIIIGCVVLLGFAQAKQGAKQDLNNISANGVVIEDEE
jgi:hypothetical protein